MENTTASTQTHSTVKLVDFERLEEPMRVIAMARLGIKTNPAQAGAAMRIVRDVRAQLRAQHRSDFDLERAQAVLQYMALGYLPKKHDCIIAVQSLAERIEAEYADEEPPIKPIR
jgi:hypothetical protein